MAIFNFLKNKRKEKELIQIEEKQTEKKQVFLLTTVIFPEAQNVKFINKYFLATFDGHDFYEFFSKVRLPQKKELRDENNKPKIIFNKPFIIKGELLDNYIHMDTISDKDLFDFILTMNVSISKGTKVI